MREFNWYEILVGITALIFLVKILKDRYNDLYGRKK